MIMVMVVMGFGSGRPAPGWPPFELKVRIRKRIRRKRKGARPRTNFLRGKSCPRFRIDVGGSAHATELISYTIAVCTSFANDGDGILGKFLGRVVRGLFCVRFRGQALSGFKRGSQSVRTGFSPVHLRLQTAVQVFEFGVAHVRTGWQTGRSGISLFFVHGSTHSTAAVILAQPLSRGLSVGKLDLAFRLCGHTVARGRTISPGAHRLQNMAIAGEPRTLKNQRAVDAPIGSDDEADFYP